MTTINDIFGNVKIQSENENLKEVIQENKTNLSCANLSEANLSCANLSEANLSCANLSLTNLSNASLKYANLSNASLKYANLSDANLSNANLFGANLFGADLRNANLKNAYLRHVDSRYLQINEDKEILFRMDCCVWPITVFHGKVMIGCKDFTFDEIREMTEEKAEEIHKGAGKRWKRFGKALVGALEGIEESGL